MRSSILPRLALCTVILVCAAIATPNPALAVVSQKSADPAKTATHSAPADHPPRQQPTQTPGELILKFQDNAVVGAVAGELVRGGQPFRDLTGDGNLDRLNAKHRVSGMRRLFGTAAVTGPIDRPTAARRHQQLRHEFTAKVAASHEKRRASRGLTKKEAPPTRTPPYLGSVYQVTVDPRLDIEEACSEYRRDPHIAYCQPNYTMEAQWTPNDPYYASSGSWGQGYDDLWGLKKMQTAEAWDVTRGAGVVVAVVDSGVDYNHLDLAANIWTNTGEIPGNGIDDDGNGFIDDVRGWDFANTDNDPLDGHGHGTHVAGTIAAVGDNGQGIVGVAPAAKIMSLKGLSDSGSGSSANLAAAIVYGADNGAAVINNSWGCSSPCSSNPVAEDAVAYAHSLGAVVVFAAGNSHNDVTLYSPQNQANSVITVAASSELDTWSYFSNSGSLIDLAAPGGGLDGSSSNRIGRNILSLRAGTTDLYSDGSTIVNTNYLRARGTSMAAPHVAGAAALVLAAQPAFTPDDVSQVLRASADDIETPGFDLLSGAGRLNARRALTIATVPRVRITSPLAPISLSQSGMLTITGDANGTDFASYRLYYAPLKKEPGQATYAPTVGAWEPLGPASTQSVVNGPLATVSKSLFQEGWSYLVKLEVTTSGNAHFSDVKEFTFFTEDPRFTLLTMAELDPSRGPCSEGDRFAWTEYAPAVAGGFKPRVGKVYNGASNRIYTIYPEPDKEGAWIDRIYLGADKIAWYETNYSYSKTNIASLSPTTGELVVEQSLPYRMHSAAGDKLLLDQGTAPFFGARVYQFDLATNTLSPLYFLPAGDPSQFPPQLHGDTVVTNMWYPGGVSDDVTVNLTDLPTGQTEVIRVLKGDWAANGIANGPGVVAWHEYNFPAGTDAALLFFNKTTKEIKTVSTTAHRYSFTTDGTSILYSAFGNETGVTKLNLYTYDIPTGTTSFYASNNLAGANNNMWASFGTRHVQWWADPAIIVRNDAPTLNAPGNQALALNTPHTLPVTAIDPEQDTVELAAVGGTWPETLPLPTGALFTASDNGNGALQWTPTTTGLQTISFLARDFSGRKNDTWNRAQTTTFLVHDPADPRQPLGVALTGSGAVNSTPEADLACTANPCSQSYLPGTVVTLTATPGTGFIFSGWTGACSGTAPCTVTMDLPRLVGANFSAAYLLSATVLGSGTIQTAPAPDINCTSGTCTQAYTSTKVLTLTATPAADHVFAGWSGACNDLDPCLIMMNRSREVTATFSPTYPLAVTVVGSGTVHTAPAPDINCTTGTCSRAYSNGTVVTLTATPAAGFVFSGWAGACSGTGNCVVTMGQAQSATATFTRNSYLLSVSLPIGGGTVHSTPEPDINCATGTCTQWHSIDSVVTLTATPAQHSYFGMWGGGCSSTGNCVVTMSNDSSVSAIFYGCTSIDATSCYKSIAEALAGAPDGSIVRTRSGLLQQSQNFNRPAALTLEGGYNASFANRSGGTTIPQLTISQGSLTLDDIIIQ